MYVFLNPQATRGVDDDSVKVQKKNYNNSQDKWLVWKLLLHNKQMFLILRFFSSFAGIHDYILSSVNLRSPTCLVLQY